MKKKQLEKLKDHKLKKNIRFDTHQTCELGNLGQHVKPANWVMESIRINNFFFSKLCLFNYMITKIGNCKIEHQINTATFF
jgi:hypothetical protein